MNLNNTELDIDFIKSQFPAFNDPNCKDWSFFENAGGSYVPKQVIERLNKFMTSTKVQPYAEYSMSKKAGEQMDEATNLFAQMINAKHNEILIGGSTSINLYVLSNALKSIIKKGDEIIVTNQDHEANISPWRRLVESGAVIKEWKINNNAELDLKDFQSLLSAKTKIVAVTHCSNIVGTVNNLKKISELAHKQGAIVIGDGVSYAPHGFPNVKELGVDFYTFSLYKTFGPHLGLLYGKEEIFKKLPNQNHQFLEGNYPYTINPGGPNHEELASLIGIYEYIMNIYDHHFHKDSDITIRQKIDKINILISQHEEKISNPLLEYISKREDFNLIGKKRITNKDRAPTIAFTVKNKSSKYISDMLISNKIATRNDNFYAWRCLKALGIDTEDGVIRLSMVHYNTEKEIRKILKVLDKI